jgi:hypothetical protein
MYHGLCWHFSLGGNWHGTADVDKHILILRVSAFQGFLPHLDLGDPLVMPNMYQLP